MALGPGPADRPQFVRSLIMDRLEEHQAWPAKIFALECEKYNIFQNVVWNVLKDMEENGEIGQVTLQLDGDKWRFFTRPDSDSEVKDDEMLDDTRRFSDFLTGSGHFASLTAYIALCKIREEIPSAIQDVLPEGRQDFMLAGVSRPPDGVLMLPREYVPVEVYNGRDYLGTNTKKFRQIRAFSSDVDDQRGCNPLLINRRSDQEIKAAVRQMDGMVVDTDCIIACEDTFPDIENLLRRFNVNEIVELIPSVETADGVTLDGEYYDDITDNTKMADLIRPPSKMASAAEILPEDYLQRIRGGVQLQYVNSFYRRSTDPTRSDACYVLQSVYNVLLREGGLDRRTALDEGWEDAKTRYRRINSGEERREMILDETGTLLNRLLKENVLIEKYGNLYARNAKHPQQDLSY